jgi:hypothetical protein
LILPGASRPAGPVGDLPVKDAEQRLPAPEGTPPGIKGDPPVRKRIEAPAPAGSTGEMRLSAEQVRSNERAIEDLEGRTGDLEGTEAPHDLIAELDRIDPHAPDAARRIRLLLDRVRRWEGAKPEPAGPGVAELTEEAEAARRATLGERAERIEANKTQGSSGEIQVFDEIVSGQSIPELGVAVKAGRQPGLRPHVDRPAHRRLPRAPAVRQARRARGQDRQRHALSVPAGRRPRARHGGRKDRRHRRAGNERPDRPDRHRRPAALNGLDQCR